MAKQQQHPLTQRLRGQIDPEDLRELQALESAANARFVHAASNGVIGRVWSIAKELFIVIGFVVFVATRWAGLESSVADLHRKLNAQPSVQDFSNELAGLKMQVAAIDTQLKEAAETLDRNRITTSQAVSDIRRRLSQIEVSVAGQR